MMYKLPSAIFAIACGFLATAVHAQDCINDADLTILLAGGAWDTTSANCQACFVAAGSDDVAAQEACWKCTPGAAGCQCTVAEVMSTMTDNSAGCRSCSYTAGQSTGNGRVTGSCITAIMLFNLRRLQPEAPIEGDGEEVFLCHGLDYSACGQQGCCEWYEGECWSAVGNRQRYCSSGQSHWNNSHVNERERGPPVLGSIFFFAIFLCIFLCCNVACITAQRKVGQRRKRKRAREIAVDVCVNPLETASMQLMIVTCPLGVSAGSEMEIEIADGHHYNVVVPTGVVAGQQFQVQVPATPAGNDKTTGIMESVARDCVVSFPGGRLWQELLDQLRREQQKDALSRRELSIKWKDIRTSLDEFAGGWMATIQARFFGSLTCEMTPNFAGDILEMVPDLAHELDSVLGKGPLAGDGVVSLACVFMDESSDVVTHPNDKNVGSVLKGLKKHEVELHLNATDGAGERGDIPGHCLSTAERVKTANKSFDCFCARLGSLNNDINNGYQDSEGFAKQGEDGCAWFKQWLENVEQAHTAGSNLHVIQKSDQPQETWTLGQPLGHAQTLELLTLNQLGYGFQVHESPKAFLDWYQSQPKANDRIAEFLPSVEESADRSTYSVLLHQQHLNKFYAQMMTLLMTVFLCFSLAINLVSRFPMTPMNFAGYFFILLAVLAVATGCRNRARKLSQGLADLHAKRDVAGKVPFRDEDAIATNRSKRAILVGRIVMVMTLVWVVVVIVAVGSVRSFGSPSGSDSGSSYE